MRVIGTTFILQSTLDTPLAIGVLVSCGAVCKLFSSIESLHGWWLSSGQNMLDQPPLNFQVGKSSIGLWNNHSHRIR
ncbi:hypothetical protein P8452_66480 [Trifolium repens]|nr:hypothetical protein P8452_66480 [Trifolium repens]